MVLSNLSPLHVLSLALLDAWGSCSDCGTPAACLADFDGNCVVGITDFLILLANWSPTP